MKKKYLYSLLTLSLAICGFSAWSSAEGVAVPHADGDAAATLDPVLSECIPAEGGTVKELSYILLTFPESETDIKINPDFTKSSLGTVGHYNPSAGGFSQSVHLIKKANIDYFDKILDGKEVASNQIVYHLDTPVIAEEAEEFSITFGPDVFISGTTGHTNPQFKYYFNIDPNYSDAPETFDYGFTYASWGITNNYDYTIRNASNELGSNITFLDLPKDAAIDSSKNVAQWVRESDGTIVTSEIKSFLGSMMMFCDNSSWPSSPFGVWNCILPEGLFTSGEMLSEEKTIKLTWVDPNAEPPRPEFEVTRFSFFDTPDSFDNLEGQPTGAPAPMMYTLWKTVDGGLDMMDWSTDPKSIASLNSNKGFVINTSWDEWIQCFIAEVKRKDGTGEIDTWNQETVQEIYGYGTVCKNYVGSNAEDCEAYPHPLLGCGGNEDTREYLAGVEYTLDIWFYDSMMKRGIDNGEHQLACGSYHIEFTGSTVPFTYSDLAKLVSVSPVPANSAELGLGAQTAGEVTRVNQPITFTWSAPVTMTAKYSYGTGMGLANVESCTSNADGTVWTVVPGAECISNGEGGYLDVFEFDVQAIDADGNYVKGNIGEKTNTMFVPQFNFREVQVVLESTPTIADGASISQIGMAGFSINNEVSVEPGTQIGLYVGDSETPVKEVPLRVSLADGNSILFGDFSEDGVPYELENGEQYSLKIPADMITDIKSGVKFSEMTSEFKGVSAGDVQFVNLTTDICGLAVNNSNVVKGETIKLDLIHSDDWKIDSVTFNGEDVTEQVVNNTYTTAPIEADATIVVAYKYAADVISGINDANEVLGSLKLNVWSQGSSINVKGLTEGMNVSLYTINGLKVAEATAENASVSFSNIAPGTYLIIVVGENGEKEAIKLMHQ